MNYDGERTGLHDDPEADRLRKFLGTAKVHLEDIYFNPKDTRVVDAANVDRLYDIFEKEGCQHEAPKHRIPVTISAAQFELALNTAGIVRNDLNDPSSPELHLLHFGCHVRGLHGQHRILAGKRYLAPRKQWWAVDLYLDDICHSLEEILIEEYANEKPYSEGHIYYRLRCANNAADTNSELRWTARLSSNSQMRLKSFLNVAELRNALDLVMLMPGQRPALRISMFHRIQAIKCNEEICHYLHHIYSCWLGFVGGNVADLVKINYETVKNLELLVPSVEISSLNGLVSSGQALSEFGPVQRGQILLRLRSFDDRIPSLFSFFEDFKTFEKWAHCVHRLTELNGHTVRQRLDREWRPGSFYIETRENTYSEASPAGSDGFELAYRQIWLFAMRHYPDIPQSSKKAPQYVGSMQSEVDENALANMAKLASKLGFQSNKIHDLLERSPDHHMAKQALLKARKPGQFSYNEHIFESLVERVVDCFNAAMPTSHDIPERQQVQINRKHRCGHPIKSQFLSFSRSLFLTELHWGWLMPAKNVTSLLVQRSIYLAFFGPLSTGSYSNQIRTDYPSGSKECSVPRNEPDEPHTSNEKANKGINMVPGYEDSSRFYDVEDSMMKDIIDQEASSRSPVGFPPSATLMAANIRDRLSPGRQSHVNDAEDSMMDEILDQEALPPREAYHLSAKALHGVPSHLNVAQEEIMKDVPIQDTTIQIPENHSLFEKLHQVSSHLNSAENDIINSLLEKETSLSKLSSAKSLQSVSKWNIPASHSQYSKSDVSSSYRNQKRAQTLHRLEEQSGYTEPLLPEIMQTFRSQAVPESITTNDKIRPLSSYSEQSWETPSITDDRLSKGWLGEVYLWEDGEWNMILELALDEKERFNLTFERYRSLDLLIYSRRLLIVSNESSWRALKQWGVLLLVPRKLRSEVGKGIKAPY